MEFEGKGVKLISKNNWKKMYEEFCKNKYNLNNEKKKKKDSNKEINFIIKQTGFILNSIFYLFFIKSHYVSIIFILWTL